MRETKLYSPACGKRKPLGKPFKWESIFIHTQTRKLFFFVQVSSKTCMLYYMFLMRSWPLDAGSKKKTDEIYTYTFVWDSISLSVQVYNLSSTFDIDHDEIYHHYAICRGIIMRTASVDRRLCKVVSRGCCPPRNDVNRHVGMIRSSTKGDG